MLVKVVKKIVKKREKKIFFFRCPEREKEKLLEHYLSEDVGKDKIQFREERLV